MFDSMQELINAIGKDDIWIFQIFGIIFSALLLDFIQKKILRRVQARLETTESIWDDAFIHAVRKPLSLLIWMLGISFAADVIDFEFANKIREVAVIIVIGWVLTRFIRFVEESIIYRHEINGRPVDKTTTSAVTQLLRVSVAITATLVLLQTLGFNISAVLAFGGIGGIAVGFAAKDLLANFFGGMMIYLDRPFSIGDWVRSPDKDIEGTVEKIGWRLTVIRTFDKRPLYVPNSVFNNISVENPSRMSNRRIYETIGVRYDDVDKLPTIVSEVKQMLQQHPEIDQDQTMIINFNKFGASSLDFFVYTFTKTTEWIKYHEIKQDVLFKISEIIAKHGAEIAFPTSTIHVPEEVKINHAES
ncbi:MAG: mechanosensitive ion channel family protein [Thioalkalispiraceae bacterium]|jgi:MscS family membrane protein